MTAAALALAFGSGAAGLVYEVLWAKSLSLILGGAAWAQAVVLAAFLSGLCAGGLRLGARADQAASAWRFFARLELAIAALGLAAPALLRLLAMGPMRWLSPLAVAAPAFAMGGTIPALCRAIGGDVELVYGVNSAGAALGCLAAAFWLIPGFGLAGSFRAAAVVNALAGSAAWALSRRSAAPFAVRGGPQPVREFPAVLVYAVVFLSGFVALTYEVAWTRLLALVMGSSVYSFGEMLASFIAGIALGSLLAAARPLRHRDPARLLGWAELGAGASVLALLPLCGRLPYGLSLLRARFPETTAAFYAFEAVKFGVCSAALAAPAVFLGMTLPLAVRLRDPSAEKLGGGVGAVFAANAAGNALGAFAGLMLLPWLGVESLLRSGTTVLLVAGAAVLWQVFPDTRRLRALTAAGVVLALALRAGPPWDRKLLCLGTFRGTAAASGAFGDYLGRLKGMDLPFYRDGREATVSVLRFGDGEFSLKVNGKTDASTGEDMRTQIYLGELPLLLKPRAKSALVIGWGSGVTVGSVLRHPVERVDAVELSPEVVAASRFFVPWNGRPLDDPRTRLTIADAKTFLRRAPGRYDVVISEPSNPWMAGVGGLFSAEFYRAAREHLNPGGVMVQWFHLYEMDDPLFQLALRTFRSQFPHVTLWNVVDADVILVGSQEPLTPDYREMESAFLSPPVWEDMKRSGAVYLSTLLALQSAGEDSVGAMAGAGPLNTDDRPRLEYGAPKAFFRGDGVTVVRSRDDRDDDGRARGLMLAAYLRSRGRPLRREELMDRFVYPHSPFEEKALRAMVDGWRRRYPRDPKAALALKWLEDYDHNRLTARAALREALIRAGSGKRSID